MNLKTFWNKVSKTSGCWFWTGYIRPNGYGQYSTAGQSFKVHRLAYESLVGPIPSGKQIDHLCRVRHCANPSHMEAVTQKENILRGNGFAARNARKSHCPFGHLLDGIKPSGYRYCKTCNQREDDRYYARKRQERITDTGGEGE